MGVRTVEYAGVTTAWPEQVVKGMQRFAGGLITFTLIHRHVEQNPPQLPSIWSFF